MTERSGTGTGTVARGRPRDPAVEDAVLRATLDVLRDRGYHRLRVADVAARAGSGLGALYRRWPSKRDLVLAALERAVPDREVPHTDDPLADVAAGLLAIAEATGGDRARLLSGLLSELADDPALAALVRDGILKPLRDAHADRLRRVIGDAPDLLVRADIGPGYLLMHGLVLGRRVTADELDHLVALATAPSVPA